MLLVLDIYRDEPRISSWEGPEISEFFFFQIHIHIVLISYQLGQIPKNHCFLIYQDQLFEIMFKRHGYFPELGY